MHCKWYRIAIAINSVYQSCCCFDFFGEIEWNNMALISLKKYVFRSWHTLQQRLFCCTIAFIMERIEMFILHSLTWNVCLFCKIKSYSNPNFNIQEFDRHVTLIMGPINFKNSTCRIWYMDQLISLFPESL